MHQRRQETTQGREEGSMNSTPIELNLTLEEVAKIMAGAWDEGYRYNRGKVDEAIATLHNPYRQNEKVMQ